MINTSLFIIIGIVGIVIILNLVFFLKRAAAGSSRKGKGRNYTPPFEAKQVEWRDKEIARRLEREQDDALECIKLRNETLSYYEAVRLKYEKKEAMERLGIEVDETQPEEITGDVPEEYRYRDVRDDLYILEENKETEPES